MADLTRDTTPRDTVTQRAPGSDSLRRGRSSVEWSAAISYGDTPAGRGRDPPGTARILFLGNQVWELACWSNKIPPGAFALSGARRSPLAKRMNKKRVVDPAVLMVFRKKSFSSTASPQRPRRPHVPRFVKFRAAATGGASSTVAAAAPAAASSAAAAAAAAFPRLMRAAPDRAVAAATTAQSQPRIPTVAGRRAGPVRQGSLRFCRPTSSQRPAVFDSGRVAARLTLFVQ